MLADSPPDAVAPTVDPLVAARPTFSDTVAGYVVSYDAAERRLALETPAGHPIRVLLRANTYAWRVRNLGDPYQDCTAHIEDFLVPGRFLFARCIFYAERGEYVPEAQYLVFVGRRPAEFVFEGQEWWVTQIDAIAAFYLRAQFGAEAVDYREYRTTIKLSGEKEKDNYRQETDTISRLVYGFSTAYMLTGDERYLEAAEKGTEYLREHMRFYDRDENIVYWYQGIDVSGSRETKVFASEFGDDLDAIPAYEQIYALAGPVQTYRITGDPRILRDAEMTLDLFDRFYLDRDFGGYFSHLDPITLSPTSESLGANRAKKNWNSIGDHAPAYLINLFLATGDERCARMLEATFDTIVKQFPDYSTSPFVQERFHQNWAPDRTHMWQQDRAVVGHNLKIAWNLMRMFGLRPKAEYEALARAIAERMPEVGMDGLRGGWYDVMERVLGQGEERHRFAFHDRKAWWQQEQGILAYLILRGVLGDDAFGRVARESASFYNAFFLDHDDGAVYFNVLADGVPFLVGTERFKGSHSMSGYHSTELCYLAQTYLNLLIEGNPMTLHFKPRPDGFRGRGPGRALRVAPDILPPGRAALEAVWIDDRPHLDFDREEMIVRLPESDDDLRVKVRIGPVRGGETT
jgi:mannose/cellobiose epimerase-like protein (N-acyl-D-glucosamine 2-epimerase family)